MIHIQLRLVAKEHRQSPTKIVQPVTRRNRLERKAGTGVGHVDVRAMIAAISSNTNLAALKTRSDGTRTSSRVPLGRVSHDLYV